MSELIDEGLITVPYLLLIQFTDFNHLVAAEEHQVTTDLIVYFSQLEEL